MQNNNITLNTNIIDVFSTRTTNVLLRGGICTVGELMFAKIEDILSIKNCGRFTIKEISNFISENIRFLSGNHHDRVISYLKGYLSDVHNIHEDSLTDLLKIDSNIESYFDEIKMDHTIANNIDMLYWEYGDFVKDKAYFEKSLEYAKLALSIAEKEGIDTSDDILSIAEINVGLNNTEEAIKYFAKYMFVVGNSSFIHINATWPEYFDDAYKLYEEQYTK